MAATAAGAPQTTPAATPGTAAHPAPTANPASAAPIPVDAASYQKQIRPLIQKYCAGCHGGAKPASNVNLSGYPDLATVQQDQTTWRKVLTQLSERSMPPQGMPHPSALDRDHLTMWLTQALNNADDSLLPHKPGRVLIHRLSRTEYNNTIRDLFGVDSKPADQFPADGGGGGGFDNNADTLFIPPVLMERYLSAASDILEQANPKRIFVVQPGKGMPAREAAHTILKHFATLAYRQPVDPAAMQLLMSLYDRDFHRGFPFEHAVKYALKAVLISPQFLFRVEKDQKSSSPYRISDYELASRLSYFLWSSMPDEELFRLAGQKRLHVPAVLEQQVDRMIKSPKSRALADSFAGQWLRVRDLYTTAQPDPEKFPGFTPSLRDAMYNETVDFFQSVVQDDASVLKLLDADYTYLNEDLAKHYGIPGVKGPEMRRVALKDRRRGGILTMGSVLTLTSYPRRTSPVLRGKWVLEQVLGTAIPPPPPGAGGLSQDDTPKEGLTFRQRLEQHRSKPECASCHSKMDPIGFGLENFGATGEWRTEIGGQPVDAAGVLANGEKFSGPVELKQQILARKDDFTRNLVEKMLAYALGRGLEPYDIPATRSITAAVEKDGYRSDTLIRQIVKSYPFQYRQNG